MTIAIGVLLLLLVAAFAGYTASYECLFLERRRDGRRSTGRSACACGAPIPMYRNIPVVTWLAQRGRAACCGRRIPAWYFGAELGMVLAALAGLLVARDHPLLGACGGIAAGVLVVWVWHARWRSEPFL